MNRRKKEKERREFVGHQGLKKKDVKEWKKNCKWERKSKKEKEMRETRKKE